MKKACENGVNCPVKNKRDFAALIDQLKKENPSKEEMEKITNRIFGFLRNINAGLK